MYQTGRIQAGSRCSSTTSVRKPREAESPVNSAPYLT